MNTSSSEKPETKYKIHDVWFRPVEHPRYWPAAAKVSEDKLRLVRVRRWDRVNYVTFKVGCFSSYEECEKWFDQPGRIQKLRGQGYKTFIVLMSPSRP